jgi:hypothetical protein
MKRYAPWLLIALVFAFGIGLAACQAAIPPLAEDTRAVGDTNLTNLLLSGVFQAKPTAQLTATPAVYIDNNGAGDSLVIATSGTPVFTVGKSGTTSGGSSDSVNSLTVGGGYGDTGCTISSAGVISCNGAATFGSTLHATGATFTAGTLGATGAISSSAGITAGGGYGDTGCTLSAAGVLQCDGAATIGGALTATGAISTAAGITFGGEITGNVLRYTTSGKKIVCSQTTITGTAALPHGLATPQVVMASLAGDVTGDAARVSTTNSGATVTGKVWTAQLTPVPNTTPVAVDWCVIGTP